MVSNALLRYRFRLTATLAIVIVYISYVFWNVIFANRIKVNQGCGWDGSQYCKMFFGELVMEPYSRRIFAPLLANYFGSEPIVSFFLMNNFIIFLNVVLIYFLLIKNIKIVETATVSAILISATTLYIVSKHSVKLNFTYPVLTEHLYIFFILLSFMILFALRKVQFSTTKYILLLTLAISVFLAGITRESLGPIFLIFSLWLFKNKHYLVSLVISFSAFIATYTAFGQPTNSKAAPAIEIFIHWFRMNLATIDGNVKLLTMFLIAAGPFVFFINQRIVNQYDFEERSLIIFVVIFTALSIFGGGDTDRILFPIGILLMLAFGRLVARSQFGLYTFLSASMTYFIWQMPFKIVGNSGDEILEFYGLRVTYMNFVYDNGIEPLLTSIPLLAILLIFYKKEFIAKSNPR